MRFGLGVKSWGSFGALGNIYELLQAATTTINYVLWWTGFNIEEKSTSSSHSGMVSTWLSPKIYITVHKMCITHRTSKHVGDFESKFLCDLDGGKLMVNDLYCGLEGKLHRCIPETYTSKFPLTNHQLKFWPMYVCRRLMDEPWRRHISYMSQYLATCILFFAVIL